MRRKSSGRWEGSAVLPPDRGGKSPLELLWEKLAASRIHLAVHSAHNLWITALFFAFVGHIYLQHRLLPWNFRKSLDKHKLERYNIGALEKVSSSYRGVEQFGSSSGS